MQADYPSFILLTYFVHYLLISRTSIAFMFSLAVTVDLTTAKELLVLATTPDEQKQWVTSLSHKIVRKDPQKNKKNAK